MTLKRLNILLTIPILLATVVFVAAQGDGPIIRPYLLPTADQKAAMDAAAAPDAANAFATMGDIGAAAPLNVDLVATTPLKINGTTHVNDALPGSDVDITFSLLGGTANTFLHSNGTTFVNSAYTLPATVPAANSIMHSDGTNIVGTSSLGVATLDMSAATSSVPWLVNTSVAPTTEGQAHWNSSTDVLSIGNGSTATVIGGHANGSNCTSGSAPLGVDASGAAEGCFAVEPANANIQSHINGTANPHSTTAAQVGAQTTLTNSAGLAGALSDETGTGLAVFHTNPSLVTPHIGAATGTSLALTGNLSGRVPVTTHVNASITLATAQMVGNMHVNGSATTRYFALPAAEEGESACFFGHTTGSIQLHLNSTADVMHFNGSTYGAGVGAASDAVKGSFACVIALANNVWAMIGKAGTWVAFGP